MPANSNPEDTMYCEDAPCCGCCAPEPFQAWEDDERYFEDFDHDYFEDEDGPDWLDERDFDPSESDRAQDDFERGLDSYWP